MDYKHISGLVGALILIPTISSAIYNESRFTRNNFSFPVTAMDYRDITSSSRLEGINSGEISIKGDFTEIRITPTTTIRSDEGNDVSISRISDLCHTRTAFNLKYVGSGEKVRVDLTGPDFLNQLKRGDNLINLGNYRFVGERFKVDQTAPRYGYSIGEMVGIACERAQDTVLTELDIDTTRYN